MCWYLFETDLETGNPEVFDLQDSHKNITIYIRCEHETLRANVSRSRTSSFVFKCLTYFIL
jgi:hypothetical protein